MKDKIRVLFAPSNTASMPNITLQALNKLEAIEARGLCGGYNKYWTFGKGWIIIPMPPFKTKPLQRIFAFMKFKWLMIKHILWADIIMWHWDIDPISLLVIKVLKKKIYIEWLGSDIRIPDMVFTLNPYYKSCWDSGEYLYYYESKKRSHQIQDRFAWIHASVLSAPEMSLFLNEKLKPYYHPFFQRINIAEVHSAFPEVKNTMPVLTHTPSALGPKGTKYVRQAIENLKKKELPFVYVEITDKTREEALKAIQDSDLFIDQFIFGGYGLAACEAMAMGKPVLCYLMPALVELLPVDCPIVNTNIDNLEETLERYILNASLRHDTGKLSRQYAEKYHDADKIALQLVELFKKDLQRS